MALLSSNRVNYYLLSNGCVQGCPEHCRIITYNADSINEQEEAEGGRATSPGLKN